jgi:AraC-like DNA-binding protein
MYDAADPAQPAPQLLAAHHRVASTDISVLHDAVEPLAVGHDLQARDPGTPLDGIVNGLVLESVSLVWVRYGGAGVIVDTPPTEGEFALCVPSAPMGVEYRRSGRLETAAGSLVLSHDEPMRMTPDPVAGCLVISTAAGRLTDHLHDYLGRDPARPLRFHQGGRAIIGPAMERTWRDACSLLDQIAAGGIHPMAARSLDQSILTAVLLGLPHTATAELADWAPPPRPGAAGLIREWIEAHHDQPVGVADIAAATGLSIRRVQAICRHAWDQTPMQMLRGIRLDRARSALLAADPAADPITATAAAAGFTRPSRFTAAYHQRFGETPRQTLRRAAGTPASQRPARRPAS